jgi:hypothetical protein
VARYQDIKDLVAVQGLAPLGEDGLVPMGAGASWSLPASYLEFVREIGWGDAGSLMLYSAPAEPVDIFDISIASRLGRLPLVGDDYQGYVFGIAPDGQVVEVSPQGEVEIIAGDFEAFIRGRLQGRE